MDWPLAKPPRAGDSFDATLTPGTTGTYGAWSQLSAALTHAGVWVILSIEVDGGGSAAVRVELGTGAAASEVTFARCLASNNSTTSSSGSGGASFPMFLPEGVRLAARATCTGSTAPGNVRISVSVLY